MLRSATRVVRHPERSLSPRACAVCTAAFQLTAIKLSINRVLLMGCITGTPRRVPPAGRQASAIACTPSEDEGDLSKSSVDRRVGCTMGKNNSNKTRTKENKTKIVVQPLRQFLPCGSCGWPAVGTTPLHSLVRHRWRVSRGVTWRGLASCVGAQIVCFLSFQILF